ncbi:MAG TPA: tRNA (uridine(34)/cytosine(34)/5-carboxymethylaminomethyluridine(34)-2'-O)-methyltransferase TrmL [Gammaproteobacteria bacterium]|nr:tRNA (uridine(34)/cytosine(34)/5-carboxymethylaminomethyluridine(34)-2'-O)-methyltransferase TrmL [Gammaproteobacteria bacterium]
MIHIVLYRPEIPPNTGNVIRLCANTGARLHLIEPLGFRMDDRDLRRAGLDYHEYATVQLHPGLDECLSVIGATRVFAFSVRGSRHHVEVDWRPDDTLLFGPETRGLPNLVLQRPEITAVVRLPMRPAVRSLNLSNAVAIATYEAWRQTGFAGGI